MITSDDPREQLLADIERRLGSPLTERPRRAYLVVDGGRFVRVCDREFAWNDWPLPLDTPHGPSIAPVATLIAD